MFHSLNRTCPTSVKANSALQNKIELHLAKKKFKNTCTFAVMMKQSERWIKEKGNWTPKAFGNSNRKICLSLLSAKVNTACKPQTTYLCGFHSVNIYAQLVWLHWEPLKVMEVKTKVRLSVWNFGKKIPGFLHIFSVLEKWARGGSNVLFLSLSPPVPPPPGHPPIPAPWITALFSFEPQELKFKFTVKGTKERDDLFLWIYIYFHVWLHHS